MNGAIEATVESLIRQVRDLKDRRDLLRQQFKTAQGQADDIQDEFREVGELIAKAWNDLDILTNTEAP